MKLKGNPGLVGNVPTGRESKQTPASFVFRDAFEVDVSTLLQESMINWVTLKEVMLICHPGVKYKLIKL